MKKSTNFLSKVKVRFSLLLFHTDVGLGEFLRFIKYRSSILNFKHQCLCKIFLTLFGKIWSYYQIPYLISFSHICSLFLSILLVFLSILYLLLFSNRFFVFSLSTVSEKFMSYKFSKSLNSNIKFRAKVSKGHIDLPNSFYSSNVCFSL